MVKKKQFIEKYKYFSSSQKLYIDKASEKKRNICTFK